MAYFRAQYHRIMLLAMDVFTVSVAQLWHSTER